MYLGLNNLGLNYTSSAFNPMDWFTNSEQGAWYDADNPADGGPVTAYQEATGITPVTAPGQGAADCVIGFLVDKRLGGNTALGPQLWDDVASVFTGEASKVSTGVYRVYTSAGALSQVTVPAAVVGRVYEITFTVDSIAVVGGGIGVSGTTVTSTVTTVGPKRFILEANAISIGVKRIGAACDFQISNLSIKQLPGNHATQSTTPSKPVLTARYNQFLNSPFAGAVAGSPGTAPTSWPFQFSTGTTAIPATGLTLSALAGQRQVISQAIALAANASYTFSIEVVAVSGTAAQSITHYQVNSGSLTSSTQLTVADGVGRKTVTIVAGAAGANVTFRVGAGASDVAITDLSVTFKEPDLRTSADAALSIPAYQRVTDASNYDTAGFPCRIKFDGVDDSLATSSVDFTGTDKMTVVAGIQKLSDAATGTIVESGIGGAVGSFSIFAPIGVGANFSFRLTNTGGADERIATTFTSPTTCVLSMALDNALSGAENTVKPRINGAVPTLATNADLAAAGAFANLAINIGRRNGASLPLNAYLTRLIIRGAATPDSQIVKAERSTALKMALQY
jgi:hypothetical protein